MIATRDRRASLLRTLSQLGALPVPPPVVVVDNASSDGTLRAVAAAAPWAERMGLDRNAGAGARTIGARRARTPYVAFCDDDSWWAPGALERAASHLDRNPRAGLVAGHVLVGPDGRVDRVTRAMAASPLPPGASEGVPVLGFLACAAVVRREAFLAAGGFEERLGVGGEETLLAIDMATRGWDLVYLPEVVAHHHPAARGEGSGRRRVQARNELWCAWLRRPLGRAVALTATGARRGLADPAVRGGLADALRQGAWVARSRRAVAPGLEARLRLLERLGPAPAPPGPPG